MSRIIRMLVAVAGAFGLAALGLSLGAAHAAAATASATPGQIFLLRILNNPDTNGHSGTWAHDDVTYAITVTEIAPQTYRVVFLGAGKWRAIPGDPAPMDLTGLTAMGSESGPLAVFDSYTLWGADGPPSYANLAKFLTFTGSTIAYIGGILTDTNPQIYANPSAPPNPGVPLADVATFLFSNPMGPGGINYNYTEGSYAWYYTYLPTAEVYTYSSSGTGDVPVGIFTNGG